MAKRAPPAPQRKLVWRISEAAPLGEFVDPTVPPSPPPGAPAPPLPEASSSGGWIVSSFELLNGIDVNDSGQTVPDDLFDELFPDPPKSSAGKPPSADKK